MEIELTVEKNSPDYNIGIVGVKFGDDLEKLWWKRGEKSDRGIGGTKKWWKVFPLLASEMYKGIELQI